eukprot:2160425-Amphidinium_carterae.1
MEAYTTPGSKARVWFCGNLWKAYTTPGSMANLCSWSHSVAIANLRSIKNCLSRSQWWGWWQALAAYTTLGSIVKEP